jgi:hypothetical protein
MTNSFMTTPSFPRKRESSSRLSQSSKAYKSQPWMPASAGMTIISVAGKKIGYGVKIGGRGGLPVRYQEIFNAGPGSVFWLIR